MEFAKIMYMKCLEADIFSWVFIKYEVTPIWRSPSHWESSTWDQPPNLCWANHLILNPSLKVNPHSGLSLPIGSMYAIYGNIYHQYTLNVSIYIPYMDPMGYVFETRKLQHHLLRRAHWSFLRTRRLSGIATAFRRPLEILGNIGKSLDKPL